MYALYSTLWRIFITPLRLIQYTQNSWSYMVLEGLMTNPTSTLFFCFSYFHTFELRTHGNLAVLCILATPSLYQPTMLLCYPLALPRGLMVPLSLTLTLVPIRIMSATYLVHSKLGLNNLPASSKRCRTCFVLTRVVCPWEAMPSSSWLWGTIELRLYVAHKSWIAIMHTFLVVCSATVNNTFFHGFL